SLLLLIGAGLFVKTLANLKDLSPGFEVSNLVTFTLDPTLSGYETARSKLFYRQLQEKLASLPGVKSAALCNVPLLQFNEWDSSISIEGYTPKPGEDMNPWVNYVSPRFFGTLEIPVYSGREFDERDAFGRAKVAIVNEKFAKHYFGEK